MPMHQKYDELPEETRVFLERLRPEEVTLLNESINFMRSAKTMGRFGKWAVVTVVAAFLGAAAFGDAVMKVGGWITGRHP